MIYLIDDKKDRQHKDFGWSDERFTQYANFIKPLYSIEEIVQIGENLYDEKNIILYHESFLDFTNDSQKALDQRKKLQNIAKTKTELAVAFFSGSQGSRSLNNNIAHLPVSILYQNLEIAVKQHMKGSIELKYILFGKNPEIESELNEILIQANRLIENNSIEISGKTLFIHPDEDFIQNAISNAHTEEIYQDKDSDMSEITIKLVNDYEYDNLFIPLCFGPTLSDYNGLRLATHFRCTPTKNQLKRIFIYGFVGLDYLIEHEYFNILKTKNVELVQYSKKAFELATIKNFEPLKPEELSKEIQKLKLDPPLNYADSHSIANEWAIYQWAQTIGCDETDELTKVFKNVKANLYFKYLRTINPISELDKISLDKLRINLESKPRVLLIDDEGDKGWNEIFAHLLYDNNEIDIDYLGDDFKNKSQDEIIEISIEKIFNDDIEIVILDFRLNASDFHNISSEHITSIELLKKIKEKNPGVQVIAFSATNKVWNLQAIQNAGSDGFLLKAGPENSGNLQFTRNSIIKFKDIFKDCVEKLYLIEFYNSLFQVKSNINDCDCEDDSEFEDFLKALRSQIKLIEQSGRQVNPKFTITQDVIFLNCYNFLEMFRNHYLIENDFRFYLGIEEFTLHRYEYEKGIITPNGDFIRNSGYDKPSWFQCIVGLLVDYFQVVDQNDEIIKTLWQIKTWRNNYIHEEKQFFSQTELLKIGDVMVKLTSSMKE